MPVFQICQEENENFFSEIKQLKQTSYKFIVYLYKF